MMNVCRTIEKGVERQFMVIMGITRHIIIVV